MDNEYWGPAGSLDDQIKAKERLADYHKEQQAYHSSGLASVMMELAKLKVKRANAMAKAKESLFRDERITNDKEET